MWVMVPSKKETKIGARCLLSEETASQNEQTTRAMEALTGFGRVGLAHVLLLVMGEEEPGGGLPWQPL